MYASYKVTCEWLTFSKCFSSEADITPEEIFNMFFGGFGGNSMSGGRKIRLLCKQLLQSHPQCSRETVEPFCKIIDNKVV